MPLSDPFTNYPPEAGAISDAQPLQRPRVVVLGSSTAVGVGASSPALSWAGRLATALEPFGLSLVNVSVSGTDMNWALAQFPVVAALNPAVVILATSPWNCGLGGGDPAAAFDDYVAKVTRLAGMCEQIGARVIWFAGYPKNGQPALSDKLLPLLYDALEKWALWDCFGQCDAGGEWRAGFSDDGTHPNTGGHGWMFDGITLSTLFARPEPSRVFTSWQLDGADASYGPLLLTLQRGASALTASMWFKYGTVQNSRAYIAFTGTNGRIRNGTNYGLGDAAGNSAEFGVGPSTSWQHLALGYTTADNVLRFWLNGEPVGTYTGTFGATPSFSVAFLGRIDVNITNTVTGFIARPQAWRTLLNDRQVKRIYGGGAVRQSLVLDAPLLGDVEAGRAGNPASGLDVLGIRGVFTAQQTFRDVVS